MSDPRSIALRQIQREQAMRDGGSAPPITAVRKLLDFVSKDELYRDESIRRWIIATSSTNDYRVVRGVLKIAAGLVAAGFPDDALAVFDTVAHTLTSSDPSKPRKGLRQADLDHLPELEKLICLPGLVSGHPVTWGKRLVELQSDTLYDHQKTEWPSTMSVRATLSEHLGEPFDQSESFLPEYDDAPDHWYYQHGRVGHDARLVIGVAVDRGLSEATRQATNEAFSLIVGQLIDTKWGIALCQPLVALYDALRGREHTATWLPDAALGLLATSAIEGSTATWHWRRLLRLQLTTLIDAESKGTMIETIRQHASNDYIRLNELRDLESWNALSEADRAAVAEARQAGDLCEPYDPREFPKTTLIPVSPRRVDEFVSSWPHKEDHESLKSLSKTQSPPTEEKQEELEAWLLPRVAALNVIVSRSEARADQWFGEITGWCTSIVAHLKKLVCVRENVKKDQLRLAMYEASLKQHCPWWSDWADTCLEHLDAEVPSYHRKQETGHLGWGSNDPIYTSLSYLDELLAVERGPSLEGLRERLAQIIRRNWEGWPWFTRATALTVLRPYHWAIVEQLHSLLDAVAEETLEADVLQRVLEHILRRGATNIVERLKSIWSRIENIDDPARIARFIGQVLGNATLRARGDREPNPVLEELATWCDEIRTEGPRNSKTRMELIHGVVWAAKEHLGGKTALTTQHADVWLGLARWGAAEFLVAPAETRRHAAIMQAIMFVLEMNWPVAERRRLYDELGDVLERIIREGDLDEYSTLLFNLKEEVGGASSAEGGPARSVAPGDELLLRLCRASAERVAEWREKGETTNDLGYVQALSGRDTAGLMEHVVENARDREYVRRELPQVIDILASAGLTSLATELRLKLRRG